MSMVKDTIRSVASIYHTITMNSIVVQFTMRPIVQLGELNMIKLNVSQKFAAKFVL